ncbi:MAG: aspartate aminotransferase family protein [Pseudomonadota bacterium]|nr:aspartate aminotransferase family protein [Pseudomonadota bacterium]
MAFLADLIASRQPENFALHEAHLNTQMVRLLRAIGYDRHYVRAQGPYLFDEAGDRYLDLLSGWGVFAVGRNHPTVIGALRDVLELQLPDLVQLDVSVLSGLLAERLLRHTPGDISKLFFCNSGAEAVEAAIKFSRSTTKRARIVHCEHAFHGLTMGALSVTGEHIFQDGFGPLVPHCTAVPFSDLAALDAALRGRDVAAFIVEPIQGKGVNIPDDDYLPEAARLCRKYGTLFVADEIQTGMGRTGKFFAVEHWGVEPDMVLMAKALSGGFVPVGAVAMRKPVMDAVFNRIDRAVVHGSTFSKNNMAMAAGLATLEVIESERLVEHAAALGGELIAELGARVERYEFLKAVRGKGLMIALEFGAPRSLGLKAAWGALELANKGLFSQMISIPLFKEHRILTQVAGHGMNVIKLLPPLVINGEDKAQIVSALDAVIADCHRVPGAVWDLGKTLAGHALKSRAA